MTERAPQDLSFTLGRIMQQLDTITGTLSEDRKASAQYRTDIRKELTAVRDDISGVRSDLVLAKQNISDMKPKVDSLDTRASMSKGAVNLAIALGKFAHILSAAIGGAVVFFLERWFGRP
jgi:hypothetical protein